MTLPDKVQKFIDAKPDDMEAFQMVIVGSRDYQQWSTEEVAAFNLWWAKVSRGAFQHFTGKYDDRGVYRVFRTAQALVDESKAYSSEFQPARPAVAPHEVNAESEAETCLQMVEGPGRKAIVVIVWTGDINPETKEIAGGLTRSVSDNITRLHAAAFVAGLEREIQRIKSLAGL